MTKPVSATDAVRRVLGHFDSFGADHMLSELNRMGYHLAPIDELANLKADLASYMQSNSDLATEVMELQKALRVTREALLPIKNRREAYADSQLGLDAHIAVDGAIAAIDAATKEARKQSANC